MKGEYQFKVRDVNVRYDFTIRRNITFIRGDSGTGKTTLIQMLSTFADNGKSSGIAVESKATWLVLSPALWEYGRDVQKDKVLFIDENSWFLRTHEFAEYVRESGNYFVIITRYPYDGVPSLPYSVNEIYRIHTSNRFNTLRPLYDPSAPLKRPDIILVEDGNTGYHFFKRVTEKFGMDCLSAEGKSKIIKRLDENDYFQGKQVLVVADGAAFGSELNRLQQICEMYPNIQFWLPESFEYLLLSSNMFKCNKYIQDVLESPSDYISTDYFSWERFFTELLEEETRGYPCQYSKCGDLNSCYTENCCHKPQDCPMRTSGGKIEAILVDRASLFKPIETTKLQKLNLFGGAE